MGVGVFMSQLGLCRSGLSRCQVYVNRVNVTFVFMSQSALCRSVNVAFSYMSFGLLSFGLIS